LIDTKPQLGGGWSAATEWRETLHDGHPFFKTDHGVVEERFLNAKGWLSRKSSAAMNYFEPSRQIYLSFIEDFKNPTVAARHILSFLSPWRVPAKY
jgi:hypothetical protein